MRARTFPGTPQHPERNPKLRDDISTDEITPAHICFFFDETLGEFPYTGLKCGNETPIKRGDVKRGGFVCAVSGKRRGKGSSREQSPYAEMSAGIKLVIAENIERIYKQNCQNLGVLTATDFSLIDKIRRGEEIPLTEFTQGEDEITRQVIEYGGLFPFNVARLQGKAFLPPITTKPRPMTIAEKIFARHMLRDTNHVGVEAVKPGDTGFARTDLRFSHEYVTPMAAIFFEHFLGKDEPVTDASTVMFFRDHLTFLDEVLSEEKRKMGLLDLAGQLKLKQEDFAKSRGIKLHGELRDRKGSEGICHSIVTESYALPGQLNVGSDSHTPHVGAMGCVAFGIGTTDVFNSWFTKDVRVKVPESVKVVVRGKKRDNVTAKDFILKLLSLEYIRHGHALAKVIEYSGEAIEALGVDERATMTNMAAEIGGFTGIVAPDQKVVDFLVERRGMSLNEAETLVEGLYSDPDAHYSHVIELDAADIYPMVATPGDPGQRQVRARAEHAGAGRDRLRRHLHRGQERRHGHVRGGAERCAETRPQGGGQLQVLSAVRLAGDARILRAQRLSRHFPAGGRDRDRAQLRRVHQCRAGGFDASRPGGDQRAEPQLPRAQRAGADVSGESADGGGQRGRGLHRGVRTGEPARARQRGVRPATETALF